MKAKSEIFTWGKISATDMHLRKVFARTKDKTKLKGAKWRFVYDGDFTICMLQTDGFKKISVGASKRNPFDPKRRDVGGALSLRRAIKNLGL
jgi:hypothetical protein